MYDLNPVEVGKTNIIAMAELLQLVFPETDKFSPEFLEWQYAYNPLGRVVGFNAFHEGELAAHYATIPVKWMINGKPKKGLLSLNTATHPKHRGKGLFTQLAEKTYALGKELGYEFVIGVANANSTTGFLKKLNFKLIAPLNAYISTGTYNQSAKGFKSHSIWEEDTLQWRIINPEGFYFKNGGIISKTHIPFIKAYLLNADTSTLLLRKKRSLLKLHIGLNNTPSGISVKIPKKMQPSPLNLIYRPLSDHNTPLKEDILFRLIDFDAY